VIEKPGTLTMLGIGQILLGLVFIIWLLGFPAEGAVFAWPTTPGETAIFLGAGFLVRAYIGLGLVRERYWARLRWQVAANYLFLAFAWLATLWHMDEMNWESSIWIAHAWALAYTIEPVILYLWEPKGPREPLPPEWHRGPVHLGLRQVAMVGLVVAVTLAGLMMINPEFMDTRWPWPLDPFNCRVMSAFLAMNAGFCYSVYVAEDWTDARSAVIAAGIFVTAEFAVWLAVLPGLDPSRPNRWVFGALLAAFAIALAYCFVRQERSTRAGAAA
jgi:hypothetical protein